MMNYLSLFSGIGAFESAMKNLNIPFNLVGFSEIDKYAVKSYCAIQGVSESLNLGDITKIDETELPKIDFITYGFPCQDISQSGLQKGLFNDDGTKTRSGLFFDALRIIEHTKPMVAIAENVKNLTSKKFSEQFKIVLDSLESAGYNNYWKVLNAKDFAIPQNRERVFIISIRKDVDTGAFEFPEGYPLTLRLKDMLEETVDEKFYISQTTVEKLVRHKNRIVENETPDVSHTIHSGYYKMGGRDQQYIKDSVREVAQVGNLEPKIIRETPLEREGWHNYAKEVLSVDGICRTLSTQSNNLATKIKETTSFRIRKLTPKECFRLMGFKDEEFEKAEKVCSNTQLYKQAGNSIVVDVAEELLCMLFDEDGMLFV